jgi:hypothetical protein
VVELGINVDIEKGNQKDRSISAEITIGEMITKKGVCINDKDVIGALTVTFQHSPMNVRCATSVY